MTLRQLILTSKINENTKHSFLTHKAKKEKFEIFFEFEFEGIHVKIGKKEKFKSF